MDPWPASFAPQWSPDPVSKNELESHEDMGCQPLTSTHNKCISIHVCTHISTYIPTTHTA